MPINVFENHQGKLVNATNAYGLSGTSGWWTRILADDFDNDGDTDIVVGNLGLNTQLKASANELLTITYSRFYWAMGLLIQSYVTIIRGKSYPYFSKDEISYLKYLHCKKSFCIYSDVCRRTIE